MTKKDYIKISECVNNSYNYYTDVRGKDIVGHVMDNLVKMFKEDNPNFNSGRFIEVCLKETD